jgi:hypothetical protein
MATIKLLRYSSAKTKAAVLAEVSTADSKDHGTGSSFGGLCVAVECGQDYDAMALLDPSYEQQMVTDAYNRPILKYVYNLQVVSSPAELEADICSQGVARRKMWRLTVDSSDIVGLSERFIPYPSGRGEVLADGVILRRGAKVLAVEAVAR